MKESPKIHLPIPPWIGAVYLSFCAILIPWTIYLSLALPTRHLSRHWDVSWGGLDVGIVVAMLLTAILALKKSKWVTIPTSVVGTLLLVDAWFDITSSHQGIELSEALLMAIVFELPVALMSYLLAWHVLNKNLD